MIVDVPIYIELVAQSSEFQKNLINPRSQDTLGGGLENVTSSYDKTLAQTFLVKKARYRNATLVISAVNDTNEGFSHAHDMGLYIVTFIKIFMVIL